MPLTTQMCLYRQPKAARETSRFSYSFILLPLLNISAAISEKNTAAATPAAHAVKPPINAPISPFSSTASRTPLLKRYPKPVSGTVAPPPAKSTSGL